MPTVHPGLDDDAGAARDDLFGDITSRLAAVRAAYDPDGVFAAAAKRP